MAETLARRLDQACRAVGHPIVGVSIGRAHDRRTWAVQPAALQAACQPLIDAFDPDDLLPRDWGTVLRLLGEVGAGTAVLGAMAYDMVTEARRRGHLLVQVANRDPAAEKEARRFEQQFKNGIARATELMEDALRSAPHWLQTQLITIVDPTSEVGKKVQEQLRAGLERVRSRRQTPILGPVGRMLSRITAGITRWLDPTACP